jgi:hypothetical protein
VCLVCELVGHVLDCALGFANGLLSITLCLLRGTFCTQPVVANSFTDALLDLTGGFVGIAFDPISYRFGIWCTSPPCESGILLRR